MRVFGTLPKKIKAELLGDLAAHTVICYRCFLPDLTGFTKPCRARPNKTAQILARNVIPGSFSICT